MKYLDVRQPMNDTDPRISMQQLDAWLTDTTEPDPIPRVSRFETTLPGIGCRRQQERVRFQARVEALPLEGRGRPIWGTTEDICHRGVFVMAKGSPPRIDALVILRIHTVHGLLQVKARVVHNIESVGFGCEFVDLDENQRVALSLLVSTRSRAPRRIRRIH